MPATSSRRPRAAIALACLLACVVLAGCGGGSSSSSSTTSSSAGSSGTTTGTAASTPTMGFENVPIEQGTDIAPASTTQTGTVDGISCGPTEQLAYHIHAHLLVYDNGTPRALPGGIGIPGSQVVSTQVGPVAEGGQCIYWLHTHAPDGVIHIESPTQRIYTLGQFFDEWHQPLSGTQVGLVHGPVHALVDGRPWKASPRNIPLDPHTDIQLDVGSPDPAFQSVDWSRTQL